MVSPKTNILAEENFPFVNFIDPQKDKVDPRIAICGLLIWTLMYIGYGWWIQLWYTEKNYNLIGRGNLGKDLHHSTIRSIYRITTLMCFQDIWKIHLVCNIQIHRFSESADSLYCYFKLVQWQCHIFIETHTSF